MATRIRLSRAKGWRMPPNTVKVDRSTRWGNPFRVGIHGEAETCARRFRQLVGGHISMMPPLPVPTYTEQAKALDHVRANLPALRGKNLACWCPLDAPCHADVLLELANTDQIGAGS